MASNTLSPTVGRFRITCTTPRGPVCVGNFPTLAGASTYAKDLVADTRVELSAIKVEGHDSRAWHSVWSWGIAR